MPPGRPLDATWPSSQVGWGGIGSTSPPTGPWGIETIEFHCTHGFGKGCVYSRRRANSVEL